MKYNNKIIYVMVVICAMFLSLALYLTWFALFDAPGLIDSNYNKRIREREERVLRGSIYDSKGEVLAYSVVNENKQERIYPFKERYAHIIGYNSIKYNKSGLEASFNDILTTADPIEGISKFFSIEKDMPTGSNLYLTIDNGFTKKAQQLMQGRNGAVVALVPKTGEVICMYSNPSFDPNETVLEKNFSSLSTSDNAPFVGRGNQGLYPPGSTFKIITAAAALEAGCAENITDEGKVIIDGYEITNYDGKELGEIDIKTGFAKSSNVMFAKYGVAVGEKKLTEVAGRFCIGETIDFDIRCSKSLFNYKDGMHQTDLAACGIGQGKLLVTPLNMALVAAGIANDGVIMKPYIVKRAEYLSGRKSYTAKAEKLSTAVSKETSDMIEEYMIACVKEGTGRSAAIENIGVAGKTGTAENEREGKEHAWFICYAPYDDPCIAICVMQEYTGKTGSSCAPIARELIKYYMNSR